MPSPPPTRAAPAAMAGASSLVCAAFRLVGERHAGADAGGQRARDGGEVDEQHAPPAGSVAGLVREVGPEEAGRETDVEADERARREVEDAGGTDGTVVLVPILLAYRRWRLRRPSFCRVGLVVLAVDPRVLPPGAVWLPLQRNLGQSAGQRAGERGALDEEHATVSRSVRGGGCAETDAEGEPGQAAHEPRPQLIADRRPAGRDAETALRGRIA